MTLVEDVVRHPEFGSRRNEYIRWYPKSLKRPSEEPVPSGSRISGVYVHVPFCDRICRFCPFNKRLTDDAWMRRYAAGLIREIELYAAIGVRGPVRFVYFGGGTPSTLDARTVSTILDSLARHFGVESGAEISLETHPTHAVEDRLRAFCASGVNRISMGIQSFDDALLTTLGATHAASDSALAVDTACRVFENTAIDLLYGFEPQTMLQWNADLRTAVEQFGVKHVSCYPLVPINGEPSVSERGEVELASHAFEVAAENGLKHYASCASGGFDVATEDRVCRYELGHWQAPQDAFLGLGPGAFGFVGNHQTANVLRLDEYCDAVESSRLPLLSAREVNESELRRRFFVLGVKTLEVDLTLYERMFGRNAETDFATPLSRLEHLGFGVVRGGKLVLTDIGRLYVDMCSSQFFSEGERDVPHPEEPELRELARSPQT